MKKIIKGFITWEAPRYSQGKPTIDFYAFDPRKTTSFPDVVVVKEHEIEIEVPDDFDPRPSQIANLRKEELKARADFEARITQIKRKIAELEAIEFTPEGGAA